MAPIIQSQDGCEENLYYTLFEQHHLPVLIIRPVDGQIVEVNQTACQFYQYEKETLKRMTIFDINTLPMASVKQKMAEAKRKKERYFQFRHRLKDGNIREVKVNSIPVTFRGETLLFSLVTDVTDLLENNSYFNVLFEQSPYAIMVMDQEYRVKKVNQHFEALFGYKHEETIGRTPEQLIYPKGYTDLFESNKEKINEGMVITQNNIRQTKSGQIIHIQLVAMPVYVDNVLLATCAIYIDKRKETELKTYNQMLASVLENTNQGVVITNSNGDIEWINDAYTTITGYTEKDVLGKNPRILQSGKHTADFYEKMWEDILTHGSWTGEIWNRRKSGEIFPEFLKIFSIKDEAGDLVRFVGIFIDNTEMKAHERAIDVLETKDKLTNLYNRSFITRYIDQWLIGQEHPFVTLLYIDIDRFKTINDNLGHAVGDDLLIQFANKLRRTFKSSLLSRVSGDEFVVVMLEEDHNQVDERLEDFFKYLDVPFDLEGYQLLITCSVGVAIYPTDGASSNALLMHADIAMFEAKKHEGNTFVHYNKTLATEMNRIFEVKTALQQADFDRDFTLHYQPVVDVKTDQVVGAEALLRFENDTLGRVSPGEFIPIAEDYGLILPIGEWVLRQACSAMREVVEMTEGMFKLAVNVSIQQLENSHFPVVLKMILEETTFPKDHLILEVTEETSVSHSARVKETINQIEALGVGVSIDDFGTGYSSLEKLHQLKVNQLKIDQSFIRDLDQTKAIVHAILAMGKSLGLSVVAEGVETKEQRDFLKATTCDYVQGYYYSRPIPFKDFQAYVIQKQSSNK